MHKIELDKHKDIRKGQQIFNWLEWLLVNGHAPANQNQRMADPFFLEDEEFDRLYNEFEEIQANN